MTGQIPPPMEPAAGARRDENALVSRADESVSPRTSAPQLRPGYESARVHIQHAPSDLTIYNREFMHKVMVVLGAGSPQYREICDVLGKFQDGKLSKRNVHLIISQILHGHDELIMDFIGVLNHPEAKWGVGDFLMPSSWNAPTHYRNSSEYLEPQQEQQVQPPSMPSDWHTPQYEPDTRPTTPFVNPAFIQGQHVTDPNYGGYGSYHNSAQLQPNPFVPNGLSSSSGSMQSAVPHTPRFTHRYLSQLPDIFNTRSSEPTQTSRSFGSSGSRHEREAGTNWRAGGEPAYQMYRGSNQDYLPPASLLQLNLRPSSRNSSTYLHSTSQDPTPSTLGTPNAVHLGQTIMVEAPSYPSIGDHNPPPSSPQLAPPKARKSWAKFGHSEKPQKRAMANTGDFIHALCGKSFSDRHAVKKHHWGTKPDEKKKLNGCWYKMGQPAGSEWDDHPTCRAGRASQPRPRKSKTPVPESPDQNAEHDVDQDELARNNNEESVFSRAIFRDPSHSQYPAGRYRYGMNENEGTQRSSMVNEGDPSHVPMDPNITLSQESMSPDFDLPRMPSGRDGPGMDSLLTAVNHVSQLDASSPQDPNGPAVWQLDGQAAIAADTEVGRTPWVTRNLLDLPWSMNQEALPDSQEALYPSQYLDAAAPDSPMFMPNGYGSMPVPMQEDQVISPASPVQDNESDSDKDIFVPPEGMMMRRE